MFAALGWWGVPGSSWGRTMAFCCWSRCHMPRERRLRRARTGGETSRGLLQPDHFGFDACDAQRLFRPSKRLSCSGGVFGRRIELEAEAVGKACEVVEDADDMRDFEAGLIVEA